MYPVIGGKDRYIRQRQPRNEDAKNMPYCESVTMAQWVNDSISLSVLPVAWVQFPVMADHPLPTRPGHEKNGSSPLDGTTQLMEIEEEG